MGYLNTHTHTHRSFRSRVYEVKINTEMWIMQNEQIKHIRDAVKQRELTPNDREELITKRERWRGGGGEGRKERAWEM